MQIRRLSDGQKFEGPDGPVPSGYEMVQAQAPTPTPAPSAAPTKAPESYPGSTLGLPKIKTGLDVILNPEGIPQHLISLGMTGGAIGKGGQLAGQAATKLGLPELAAKVAPAIGRSLTAGGIGAAESLNRGESGGKATTKAAMDLALSGAMEGLMGLAGRPSKAVAKLIADNDAARKAYEWAKTAPDQALAAIRGRVPATLRFFEVPALGAKPMTLDEAVSALKKARGADYEEGLAQLSSELSKLEFRPRVPSAGESFAMRVSPKLFEPEPLKKTAKDRMTSPEVRAGLDALMIQPGAGGWPTGAMGAAMAGGALGNIPEHLARMLMWRGIH